MISGRPFALKYSVNPFLGIEAKSQLQMRILNTISRAANKKTNHWTHSLSHPEGRNRSIKASRSLVSKDLAKRSRKVLM